MKTLHFIYLITVMGLFNLTSCTSSDNEEPKEVELAKTEEDEFRLFVNGETFFVKGAGCEFGSIPKLADHGANSFRTWRTDNGKQTGLEVLDEAEKYGLMVMMGLEIGRERHGYDYNDTAWVKEQHEYIKGEVLKYKDHPALLGWGIGNELNLSATNMKVWDAVNDIAEMIHEVDGNHPTTTMLAGISKEHASYLQENALAVDFLSIQMYGDIVNLRKRLDDAGYTGPYLVTEWGATGHWEVARTEWDVAIEQTSTEKAEAYKYRYEKSIAADSVHCMGSYVFLWGQKQERTPTWYGMFLETGEQTETVDAMHKVWTGEWPENRCPSIDSVSLNGLSAYDNIYVDKASEMNAFVDAFDRENDTLSYIWEILPESTDLGEGGDFEERPETIFELTTDQSVLSIKAPEENGPYRLYVYIFDGHNNAATANIPFYVQ